MRHALSALLFTAGSVCALLAVARLIFGVAIGVPSHPLVSLAWIDAAGLITAAIACFIFAAIARRPRARPVRVETVDDDASGTHG